VWVRPQGGGKGGRGGGGGGGGWGGVVGERGGGGGAGGRGGGEGGRGRGEGEGGKGGEGGEGAGRGGGGSFLFFFFFFFFLFPDRSCETDVLALGVCESATWNSGCNELMSQLLWGKSAGNDATIGLARLGGHRQFDGGINACCRDLDRFGSACSSTAGFIADGRDRVVGALVVDRRHVRRKRRNRRGLFAASHDGQTACPGGYVPQAVLSFPLLSLQHVLMCLVLMER